MAESELSDLKGDVRVLAKAVEAGQVETNRRLDKIENKIDAQANVPVAAFEEYKKDAQLSFINKDQFSPIVSDVKFLKKVLYTVVGIIVTAVIGAVLRGLSL